MDITQMGWVMLIIANIYIANDKNEYSKVWIIMSAVAMVAGVFI